MSKIISAFAGLFPIGQRAIKRGASASRKLFRGFWSPRALYPISVSDPQKLNDVFGWAMRETAKARALRTGKVADSDACRVVQRLYDLRDLPSLREFERLLSGGGVRWSLEYENLVVNVGLDHALDVVLSGGTQDTTWFIGYLGASPTPVATWVDTDLAAVDFVNYDEATLSAFVDGGVSGQSVSNAASPAVITCSTNGSSIGGAFLIGTNAKATPAGTVYAAGAFTGGNKALDDGDTLETTATFTAADA